LLLTEVGAGLGVPGVLTAVLMEVLTRVFGGDAWTGAEVALVITAVGIFVGGGLVAGGFWAEAVAVVVVEDG